WEAARSTPELLNERIMNRGLPADSDRSHSNVGAPVMSSVDIVIPCYNYGRYLQNCVQSILQQRGVDVRILIIDDASTDDSPDVGRDLARTHPQVSFVRHERNRGHIATYNEGIEWASGQYFLLISADDYLLPGALLASTQFMDDHPEVGFTFGKYLELYD